jgi:energy-coupling factor transporter ATP-binding protein EcfA2
MTTELVASIASQGVFRPRQQFSHLAQDHVPFDELVGKRAYESRALTAVTAEETVVGIIGPRGAGKSSLIAGVCAVLPDTHVALRVPVTGADDPTSVNVIAAVALSQALDDLELERYQREALERARADDVAVERTPGGLRGGTLGGGVIPAQVHAELATLREQFTTNRLAAERLAGLDRLITILVARGLQPVFVFEDTEAAIGGADRPDVADGFLSGPVHALVHEVEAACMIAVQDVFTTAPSFGQLAASMALVEIPVFDETHASGALTAIVDNRLEQHELSQTADSVVGDDALEQLIAFYDESSRNLRFTLAALQSSVEYAADTRAEQVGPGHMRAAVSDWRERLPG